MKKEDVHVLIISFFFAPDKRVGALRTSYWYRQLPTIEGFKTSVITANTEASGENIHIVPQVAQPPKWSPIKDEGVTWKKEVQNFLTTNPINADVVIITGSPFMHFGMSKWLKKRLNCKVILDYRDPFATNPGFNNSRLKVWVKKYYERKFNKSADALVTVNKYCGFIISQFYDMPNAIVKNGYDEQLTPIIKPINVNNPIFSYTGKFYFDTTPMFKVFQNLQLKMIYAGPQSNIVEKNKCTVDRGLVSYAESVNIIASTDVGIIQTSGSDHISTTKIYDYVRCKRIILIISNSMIQSGSIHDELNGFPNVYWATNDETSIKKAILSIQRETYIEPKQHFCERYSRKEQMNNLIKLIQSL